MQDAGRASSVYSPGEAKTMRTSISVLSVLLALAAAPLAAQNPVGREVFVNQSHGGIRPDVGAAADGSFVVVWEDEDQGRVWVRRYGANGKPRGGEFRVSRMGGGRQDAPAVAVRPDGSFVVVWNRIPGGNRKNELYASRFTADGRQVGSPRLVAFIGAANEDEPAAVAALPNGGFFVVWALEDGFTYWEDGDRPSRDLYGRVFNRNGVLAGSRVTLNADPGGDQRHPACVVSRGVEIACTWTSQLGEGYFGETMYRRFSLDGQALGEELQVNEPDSTDYPQREPSLAARADGTVLVAWLDSTDAERIHARLIDLTDQFLGPTFTVATTDAGWGDPQAAATEAGFAVLWSSGAGIFLREVSASGTLTGTPRQVNQGAGGVPALPAMAFGPGGGAVAWTGFDLPLRDTNILVRRLR